MKRMLIVFFSLMSSWYVLAVPASAASFQTNVPDCSLNGLYGSYYTLPNVHEDVREPLREVTLQDAPGDFDWFDTANYTAGYNDHITAFATPQTDESRFPDNEFMPGNPQFYAVHWKGAMQVPQEGDYRVMLSTHEDAWLYINGTEAVHVLRNENFGGRTVSLRLASGTSAVDIFFAKRSHFQTGINFSVAGNVRFSPCAPEKSGYQAMTSSGSFGASLASTMPTDSDAMSSVTDRVVVQEHAKTSNYAPRFTMMDPATSISTDQLYKYTMRAIDRDKDPLSFSIVRGPQGIWIDSAHGTVLWQPNENDIVKEPHRVVVQVSDGTHNAYTSFVITVNSPATYALSQSSKTESQLTLDSSLDIKSLSDISSADRAADTGSRFIAAVLYAGKFIQRWVSGNYLSIMYFFVLLIMLAIVSYVVLEMIDRAKLKKRAEKQIASTPIQPNNTLTLEEILSGNLEPKYREDSIDISALS